MTDTPERSRENPGLPPPSKPPKRSVTLRRTALGAALVAACAVGAGAGALAQRGRQPVMVSLTPAPITSMQAWSPAAIKGEVAEVFGNKFIVADGSGRALVETGRAGEDGNLVAKSETVTIQGRFENGFVHAIAVQHADGRTDMIAPPGPPPRRGPLSWLGREGGPRG